MSDIFYNLPKALGLILNASKTSDDTLFLMVVAYVLELTKELSSPKLNIGHRLLSTYLKTCRRGVSVRVADFLSNLSSIMANG
jgi:hypothetical protein